MNVAGKSSQNFVDLEQNCMLSKKMEKRRNDVRGKEIFVSKSIHLEDYKLCLFTGKEELS